MNTITTTLTIIITIMMMIMTFFFFQDTLSQKDSLELEVEDSSMGPDLATLSQGRGLYNINSGNISRVIDEENFKHQQ